MDKKTVDALLELLHDRGFQELHRLVSQESLSWEAFRTLAMPFGLTHEQAWDIIVSLRRDIGSSGSVHQIKPFPHSWHVDSSSVIDLLKECDDLCSSASPLSKAFKERSCEFIFKQAVCDELVVAAKRDGYRLGYEEVRALVLHKKEPQSLVEQAVVNVQEFTSNLASYAERPFDMCLVNELHGLLLKGSSLDRDPLSDIHKTCADALRDGSSRECTKAIAPNEHEILKLLLETGNGTGKHPLQDAIGITFIMVNFKPFAAWNGLLELMFRRLVLYRSGYGCLAYLPYSKMHLAFEDPMTDHNDAFNKDADNSRGVDFTPRICALLDAILQEAKAFKAAVEQADKRDEALIFHLSADPDINTRQRKICELALKRPDLRVSIRWYAEHFQIVKGSARNDLLRLFDRGLIRKRKEGKEIVFFFPPDLPDLMSAHKPFTLL
ncbi:MAG: hypothetical protein LBG81_00875 [Coriobacteriaceae bacterium]|jgi:DNA-binding transcriptional ArsR family regulator|nr:hypothetical protein [Coriobacteriaceae bacterium]